MKDKFYNIINFLSKEIHFFDINDIEYQLYNNGHAVLVNRLCDNNFIENLYIVPVMLSCTDTFILSYIKNHCPLEKKGQLSIFDFD